MNFFHNILDIPFRIIFKLFIISVLVYITFFAFGNVLWVLSEVLYQKAVMFFFISNA